MTAKAFKVLSLVAVANYSLVRANVVSRNTNPIRKVLGMLEDMRDELLKEQDSEKELFEKAMCACSTGADELTKVIDHSNSEISRLTAKIDSQSAAKSKLDSELIAHKADKASTEKSLAQATTVRNKEHAKFASSEQMLKFSLGQLDAAIPLIANSASSASFIQAINQDRASDLRRIVSVSSYLSAEDKDQVLGFLQGGTNAPSAGSQQIIGLLKAMRDEMAKDLKGMQTDEQSAVAAFVELKDGQLKHLGLLMDTISDKAKLSGEFALSLSQDNDALDDAKAQLNDGSKYLQSLKSTCAQKEKDRDMRAKTRSEEISAISEAMTILNGDAQMETFSKTLRTPALVQQPNHRAFLQAHGVTKKVLPHVKNKALLLSQAKRPAGEVSEHATQATKIVGHMIDNMVEVLHNDDVNDEHKKQWCHNETVSFAQLLEDKENHHAALEKKVEVLTNEIEQLKADIKALEEEINAIDQQVLQAGVQRQKEHSEFVQDFQEMDVAKQLIDKAANRLQAFYNPSMFAKAPLVATGALTQTTYFTGPPGQETEKIEEAPQQKTERDNEANYGASFIQVGRGTVVPVELPDTPKTYEKKESGGVMGLLSQMKEELAVDSRQAEVTEKHAQADYSKLMADAKVSRADNVNAKNDKEATKADTEETLLRAKEELKLTAEEIFQVKQYISRLHIECDFLMRNFESRHTARIDEEVGLESAESIATHGDPPTYPGTVKGYEEEHSKADVEEHFPDAQVPLPGSP